MSSYSGTLVGPKDEKYPKRGSRHAVSFRDSGDQRYCTCRAKHGVLFLGGLIVINKRV
jgi:hypothetical protein